MYFKLFYPSNGALHQNTEAVNNKEAIEVTDIILDLSPPKVSDKNVPFKYICVNFILHWLSLRDLTRLDSAVSGQYRGFLLKIYDEFRLSISGKLFAGHVVLSTNFDKFFVWAVHRNMACCEMNVHNNLKILESVINRKVYDFSALTHLQFISDSIIFYELLRKCPNLCKLEVHDITKMRRLCFAVTVHCRRLETLFKPGGSSISSNLLFALAMHHRSVDMFKVPKCSWKVYKAALWYQNAPVMLPSVFKSPDEVRELCWRTSAIRSAVTFMVQSESLALLLQAQTRLTFVSLKLLDNAENLPKLLSKCASITHLELSRADGQACLDWSSLTDSPMRLKIMSIYMPSEKIIEFASAVLSSAITLQILSNNEVRDEDLLSLMVSSVHLTSLSVSRARKLTLHTLEIVGRHGKALKTLHWGDGLSFAQNLVNYTVCGSDVLQNLAVDASYVSGTCVASLKSNFPSLQHLRIDGKLEFQSVKDLLDALGNQLSVFTLLNCRASYLSTLEKYCREHAFKCSVYLS